jgi:uncharacterized membrane protein YfcA
MPPELIIATTFIASFIQSITSFGFALISVPILASASSLSQTLPLVAIAGFSNSLLIWSVYRRSLQIKTVIRLIIASLIGLPFGLYLLEWVSEQILLTVLGTCIILYAVYAFLQLHLPKLDSPNWAYGFGFLSGIMLGSYNIPGPPAVFYANCKRWTPEEFKSNLTSFFMVNAVMVIIGHLLQHRITSLTLQSWAIALPGIILGFALGTWLSRFINPEKFRQAVLILLVIVGGRLILLGTQL